MVEAGRGWTVSEIDGSGTERPHATVLAEAAAAARTAPSIHNTQPWRLRVFPDALELYADRSRQLRHADPEGRLLAISCGAALHHARVALAAEGWRPEVTRFPDPGDADLLARLTLAERVEVTPAAMRTFQATEVRHTDRRPVTDEAVDAPTLAAISRAATAEGARLHRLAPDQLVELAAAAAQAQSAELVDPDWRAELEYWAGSAHQVGVGVPEAAIPSSAPQTTVPGRDFGHPGTLPVGAGHDRAAVYAILYGEGCAHARSSPDVPTLSGRVGPAWCCGCTMATGQTAWCSTAELTDPSSRPRKPPRPRDPTTSNWAFWAAVTSDWAGCPAVARSSTCTRGCWRRQRARQAVSRSRSVRSRAAPSVSPGRPVGQTCAAGVHARTAMTGTPRSAASSKANRAARLAVSDPSMPTAIGAAACSTASPSAGTTTTGHEACMAT